VFKTVQSSSKVANNYFLATIPEAQITGLIAVQFFFDSIVNTDLFYSPFQPPFSTAFFAPVE
jgi:hypothetical protein